MTPASVTRTLAGAGALLTSLFCVDVPRASDSCPTRLCRVKVVSEAETDTTSIDSILNGITEPDMTAESRCHAVYRFVRDHRFWYPAAAAMELGRPVADPVLLANCYPTTICQQDAAMTGALWAGLGYDVRYWQLGGHTTGEVLYGGRWRNFDATLGLVRRDGDGGVAGVEHTQRLFKPGVSYVERFDDYEVGHRMDLTLREGETFTRYWTLLSRDPDYWRPAGRRGLFPDDRAGHRRGLAATLERKPYRMDTRGAGVGSGLWTFQPDFSSEQWSEGFEAVKGIVASGGAVTSASGGGGELVWRLQTPYVITGAWIEGKVVAARETPVDLLVSLDRGASWQGVGSFPTGRTKLALREHVAGRFAYMLKVRLGAAAGRPAALRDLLVTTAVQVNPLSLPALRSGANRIQVSSGEQVETLTIYPDLETRDYRRGVVEESNVVTAREQGQPPWVTGLCAREGGTESVLVYRVEAPGVIRRIRWGGRFRSTARDVNELSWSIDGATWREQPLTDRWTRPDSETPNLYRAYRETTGDLPSGSQTAWLRYRFLRPVPTDEMCVLHLATGLRIDVDYVPRARAGGVPVEVTYCWDEDLGSGFRERKHTERAVHLPHAYAIQVGGQGKPRMKWVRMRVARP